MNVFGILEPFFHALSDGKLIRLTVAWILRVVAVLQALLGLLCFIIFIAFGFKNVGADSSGRSLGILLGCLLFACFGLVWGYVAAGISFMRARTILELGDSHFTVLSILSILLRFQGEQVFASYTIFGVGSCIFIWLADINPFSQMGILGMNMPFAENSASGFLGGLEMLILFLLLAFGGIVLFYALAELTVVLVEIALNTRCLKDISPANHAPKAPPVQQAVIPSVSAQVIPTSQPKTVAHSACAKCGQVLDLSATFCDGRGTKVG
jgi:hypothetical protein